MKSITLKRWLKMGWSASWTEREDKAHKAGVLIGVKQGLEMARLKENNRKRLSYQKNLAKKSASV
jgi:hypothetical protein